MAKDLGASSTNGKTNAGFATAAAVACIGVCAIAPLFLAGQAHATDIMKMMQPYKESPEDLAVARALLDIDQATMAGDEAASNAALARFRAMKPQKNLKNLMRSKSAETRALTVMGFRLLPLKRAWEDLRYMLMDSSVPVRRQVMFYVQEHPQGISLESVQLSLSDPDAAVRQPAVGAVLKTAKSKGQAAELFSARYREEKDPNVLKALRLGFTALGMSAPE